MTLLKVANDLAVNFVNEDQATALSIFRKALQAPFNTMAANAGVSPELAMLKVQGCKEFEGINFSTGEKADLLRDGVIDPAKVTRCALKNAVSVAGTLLLTNHSIVDC